MIFYTSDFHIYDDFHYIWWSYYMRIANIFPRQRGSLIGNFTLNSIFNFSSDRLRDRVIDFSGPVVLQILRTMTFVLKLGWNSKNSILSETLKSTKHLRKIIRENFRSFRIPWLDTVFFCSRPAVDFDQIVAPHFSRFWVRFDKKKAILCITKIYNLRSVSFIFNIIFYWFNQNSNLRGPFGSKIVWIDNTVL